MKSGKWKDFFGDGDEWEGKVNLDLKKNYCMKFFVELLGNFKEILI